MTKPIPDKAEVVLEYPDKFYSGTFERSSRFEAHCDDAGVALLLERPGDASSRKSVHMHIHYALFADILRELAKSVAAMPADDTIHRDAMCEGAKALQEALLATADAAMTADEEVMLLHVLE